MSSDDLTTHHIKPRSRFEDGTSQAEMDKDNTTKWDEQFHNRWHSCFSNMTIKEIHAFIDIINQSDTEWTSGKLHKLRNEIKAANGDFDVNDYLNKYEGEQ